MMHLGKKAAPKDGKRGITVEAGSYVLAAVAARSEYRQRLRAAHILRPAWAALAVRP